MTQPYSLGRVVDHDPRSLEFAAAGKPLSSLKSVRWTRRVPIFDQQKLSSCTGNAAAGWVGTDNAHRPGLTTLQGQVIDEQFAIDVYSDATKLDGISDNTYKPVDEGSSGLGAIKALKKRGLVTAYKHCFSLQATLTALTSGPVLVGIGWYENSFTPSPQGRCFMGGSIAGGHEILFDELDVENRRAWFSNSWGDWGQLGRAWFSWDDLGELLDDRGDAVVVAS